MDSPCDCINLTDEALKAHNTQIVRSWEVNPRTSDILTTVTIDTMLIEKKRGARPVLVNPTYCPWCGLRYKTEESADAR